MRNLLLKFKIIENVEVKLDLTKKEFENKLNRMVEPGGLGIVFNTISEVFSTDKREFIGKVEASKFHIKLKRKLFSFNRGIATLQGTTREHKGKLEVKTEINGFHSAFRLILTILAVMYAIGFAALAILAVKNNDIGLLWGVIGLIVHMVFIFGLFYFIGTAGTKKLKSEFLAEFEQTQP